MPAIMPIGKLDRTIIIENPTETKGSTFGEIQRSWATWHTCAANVYFGGGREFESARQINAEIDSQFQIRWVTGLTAKMRINYDGRYYDIVRIQEIGRKNRINIWATARQE